MHTNASPLHLHLNASTCMKHVIDNSSTQTGSNKDGDGKTKTKIISGLLKLCEVSLRMLYIDVILAAVFTYRSTANMDFEDTAAHL